MTTRCALSTSERVSHYRQTLKRILNAALIPKSFYGLFLHSLAVHDAYTVRQLLVMRSRNALTVNIARRSESKCSLSIQLQLPCNERAVRGTKD